MKKKISFLFALFLLFFLIQISILPQSKTVTVADGKYPYEMVEGDPLNARIYTLDNGLKVYLSANKQAPKIYTLIAVSTGSKDDPHDAQGLSHYLEHMLFKGTDRFGTKNYEMEKPLLDTITAMYERRRADTDTAMRRLIYHKIDSVSYLASGYAIANEYDKMIADIGGTESNAYTSVEETVYTCNIPSNQLDKWLTIEAERFRHPVMRLFHTELEAVYEEKNRWLDNDDSKVWAAMMSGLFQKHTYGTQTTIGSVEQLKNPSVQKIIDYYDEKYVPNNMAICLAGDLDYEKTIELINEKFGSFPRKDVAPFVSPVEDPIASPIVKEVYGPSQESVSFGYRFGGAGTAAADILTILEYILSNGTAGLIDLNLNQNQKVLDAYASTSDNKDYSVFYCGGQPREGQSLDDVKNLLMEQINLVKQGKFPDWLIPAVISNFKLDRIRAYENNSTRADAFVNSFILGIPWEKFIFNIERLSKITKEDVVNFANENLNDNYVIVYKRTGEDTTIKKITKPEITPIQVNRDDKSPFYQTVLDMKEPDIQPQFIDFKNEISELKLLNGIPVFYLMNTENDLFEIHFIIDAGTNQNKELALAVRYLNYIGDTKHSPSELKEEFYRLASSYSFAVNEDQLTVSLSGLKENFYKSLALLEDLLSNPKGSEEALKNLKSDILKDRKDAKLSKQAILWGGMYNYAKYGKNNPFTYKLTQEELEKVTEPELIKIIKDFFSYKQRILYYGPENSSALISDLDKIHKTPEELKSIPIRNKFVEKDINQNKVYVVNYDMQQAEIIMLSRGVMFDKKLVPIVAAFNEYFQAIEYQDLRESKALAYATFANYQLPSKLERSSYNIAYIGSQADKLSDAMKGLSQLINDMPEAEMTFDNIKNSLMNNLRSERITKANILFEFEREKKLGIDYDIRKDIYEKVPGYTLNDIKNFQQNYIKGKPLVTLVVGDINKLDMNVLKKYGEVKELTLKDIFGY